MIERRSIATDGAQHVEAKTNGELPAGFWWCKSEPTQTERKSSKRTQHRWACVTTWSMRQSSWRTSSKMVTAPFKASLQDSLKEAEEASWMD